MLDSCPNCKNDQPLIRYRGLGPNEGIAFLEKKFYFCRECGQAIRILEDAKYHFPEFSWCYPCATVWKPVDNKEED